VTLRWTELARNDLRAIYEYIAEDSPQAAQEFIDGILNAPKS